MLFELFSVKKYLFVVMMDYVVSKRVSHDSHVCKSQQSDWSYYQQPIKVSLLKVYCVSEVLPYVRVRIHLLALFRHFTG